MARDQPRPKLTVGISASKEAGRKHLAEAGRGSDPRAARARRHEAAVDGRRGRHRQEERLPTKGVPTKGEGGGIAA
jgi:hypothetical protein